MASASRLMPAFVSSALSRAVSRTIRLAPIQSLSRHLSSEVGTIPGTTVRIAPLRRTGEDDRTMRARLVYQSRKRGTLESDLLLSTFASTHLDSMTREQMEAYDHFLDENDWDIYYWATQKEPEAGGEGGETITAAQASEAATRADIESGGGGAPPRPSGFARPEGEWADTVGAFKPAYRPVPARWAKSEILEMLRDHVEKKRAGGMAFMPALK